MVAIGFTGTREGMNNFQRATLYDLLVFHYSQDDQENLFLHGDCLGADAQAAQLAHHLEYTIHAYPSNLPKWRANVPAHKIMEPQDPLVRNTLIVAQCDHLLACPKETTEVRRSGTWSTIRCAIRLRRPFTIIRPDGSASHSLI